MTAPNDRTLHQIGINIDGWGDQLAEALDELDIELHEAEMHTGDPEKEPGRSIKAAQRLSGQMRRSLAGIRANAADLGDEEGDEAREAAE